ncbi:MAG: alcohol dehydrogenase catalytic domain-containing protein [Candidatus Dormibacteraeota bacterium]|uniref:Alcohol dehydrogenase catalytic domain-containing protein n=1 Tax=Candidatus Amunia macphersoniae TaxID=3127014 RepID=A0A934KMQ3_9BACT|nr:alcohol dehydrogenase catalytic domain-containing protein [Candidatus Dormibacteraeota bacterium]
MQAVTKPAPAPGFTLADVAEPVPGEEEVLLRVAAASVCGTDIHLYDWNPWAAARVHPPRVIGHEICGVVVGRGPGADLEDGHRAAVESHIVCGHCNSCGRGDFHVCANTRILGVDVDGGFTELVAVPQANLFAIAPDTSSEVAAALEPLGNAVHACSYGDLADQTIAVFGCGPIGCAAIAVARAEGAACVIAIDRNRYRLELAERMGAAHLVIADENVEAGVRAAAGGADVDCALEMSGAPRAVAAATRLVRPGGWITLLGIGDEPAVLDLSKNVVMKGISLHGVVGRRIPTTWERTMEYVRSGAIDAGALITHHYAMSEIEGAIQLMKSGQCGKVSLHPG